MKKLIKITLIFTFLFSFSPFKVLGIAQVVEPILIENAFRGGEYEKSITIFNTENEEVEVKLIVAGDIKNWAIFFEQKNLKIPIESIIIPPKSNKEAVVKFLIPQDAPNKIYLGKIIVSTFSQKSEKEGASATLAQEIPREVSIKVTDKEVVACEVRILPQNFSLEKDEPFKINVVYHNNGNVKIKPSIQQKIIKGEKIIFNVIHPYPEDKKGIKPGYSETILIEWQTAGQENGEYQTEMKVLLNDKVVKEDNFRFTVGVIKSDNADNQNKFSEFIATIGGGNIIFGYILVGGFILLLSVFSFIIIKKRSKKKKEQK